MDKNTGTPRIQIIRVARGSEEELRIRRSKPVILEGEDELGHYVGVCLVKNKENCGLCRYEAMCESLPVAQGERLVF